MGAGAANDMFVRNVGHVPRLCRNRKAAPGARRRSPLMAARFETLDGRRQVRADEVIRQDGTGRPLWWEDDLPGERARWVEVRPIAPVRRHARGSEPHLSPKEKVATGQVEVPKISAAELAAAEITEVPTLPL